MILWMNFPGEKNALSLERDSGVRGGRKIWDERMLTIPVAQHNRGAGAKAVCTMHPRQRFIRACNRIQDRRKIVSGRSGRGLRWQQRDREQNAGQDGPGQH